jgi:hypothetical protein
VQASRPEGSEKPSLTSEEESGSSTSSCEDNAESQPSKDQPKPQEKGTVLLFLPVFLESSRNLPLSCGFPDRWIRILLFSSVAFKKLAKIRDLKKNFFSFYSKFIYINLQKKQVIKMSQKRWN